MRDDSVFLDRVARERIAATRVLACHATAGEVVLETCPVDEDVYLIGGAAASGERPKADTVDAIFGDRHPGRERREVEKVAARCRQLLELLRRHVRRDFRGSQLYDRRGLDGHGLQLHSSGLHCKVQGCGRTDLHHHLAPLRPETNLADGQLVIARGQAGKNVRTVGVRGRTADDAGLQLPCLDLSVGYRRAILILDVAANDAGGGLCAE